jgi:chromosome segregation ATPase
MSQPSSLPLMSAVVEVTKAQESVAAAHEAAIRALRADKEHTIEAFTAQIQRLQQDWAKQSAQTESEQRQLRSEVDRLEAALATVKDESATRFAQMHEEAIRQQSRFDARELDLSRRLTESVSILQRRDREFIGLEEALYRHRMGWTETSSRFQQALQATTERGEQTVARLRRELLERDASLNRVRSELLAAQHDAHSAKTAQETERSVLQNRIALLEKGIDEEREMNGSLRSELDGLRKRVEDLKAADAANKTSHELALARWTSHVESSESAMIQLKAQLSTTEIEKNRVLEELHLSEKRRSDLDAKVRQYEEAILQLQHQIDNNDAQWSAKLSALNESHQEVVVQLRQDLHQVSTQRHSDDSEAKHLFDQVIAEKDYCIESLRQQVRHLEGSQHSITEANDGLSRRISTLRDQYNSATERLASLTEDFGAVERERDTLRGSERNLREKCTRLEELLADALGKVNALSSSITQLQNRRDEAVKLSAELHSAKEALDAVEKEKETLRRETEQLQAEKAALALQQQELGNARALAQKLSIRTQEVNELRDENKRLTSQLITTDAKYATSETRLHHSIVEGANASVLLEKGLRRIQESAKNASETAETKSILLRCCRAIRQSLEDEGYSMAALPLAPSESLDVAYLQEALLDHASMAAMHVKRVSASGKAGMVNAVIPSALRTPMVYRSATKH